MAACFSFSLTRNLNLAALTLMFAILNILLLKFELRALRPMANRDALVRTIDKRSAFGNVQGTVCILTMDPPQTNRTRGTGAALFNLASHLHAQGLNVQMTTVVNTQEQCDEALGNVYSLNKAGLLTTCVAIKASDVENNRERKLVEELLGLNSTCEVLISHEWNSLLTDEVINHHLVTFILGKSVSTVPFITNVHGGSLWSNSWDATRRIKFADVMLEMKERTAIFFSQAVVFPTSYMREYHKSRWLLPQSQAVISNLMEGKVTMAKRELRGPLTRKVQGFAFIGSVGRRKGIDDLLQACLTLNVPHPVRVHIYGAMESDTIGALTIEQYVKEMCSKDTSKMRCIVHGAVGEADLWRDVAKNSLMFVCPSSLENQPMTLIEAAEASVPTLFYATGGVREMLTETSAEHVLTEPFIYALATRMQQVINDGVGYVPELAPAILDAKQLWLEFVREKLREKSVLLQQGIFGVADLGSKQQSSFSSVKLSRHSTTTSVGEQVCRSLQEQQEVVLLLRTGFAIADQQASQQLQQVAHRIKTGVIVGVTARVTMSNSKTVSPIGPFFFLSSGWYICGYEAPLLVQRDRLCSFVNEHPHISFHPWMLTHRLIQQGNLVVSVPADFFIFQGFLNPGRCFWASEFIDLPSRNITPLSLPVGLVQITDKDAASYDTLLTTACRAKSTSSWMEAGSNPQLCKGTVERSMFTLDTLKMLLPAHCNARCIIPLDQAVERISSQVGWSLNSKDGCWSSIPPYGGCMVWFNSFKHGNEGDFPASILDLSSVVTRGNSLRRDAISQSCGEAKMPLRAATCADKVFIVGPSECGTDVLAAIVRSHPQTYTSDQDHLLHPESPKMLADYMNSFTADARVHVNLAPGFDYTHKYTMLPTTIRTLFPTAKVIFTVCEQDRVIDSSLRHMMQDPKTRSVFLDLNITSPDALGNILLSKEGLPCENTPQACRLIFDSLTSPANFFDRVMDWVGELGDHVMVVKREQLLQQTNDVVLSVLRFSGLSEDFFGWKLLNQGLFDSPIVGSDSVRLLFERQNRLLDGLLQTLASTPNYSEAE